MSCTQNPKKFIKAHYELPNTSEHKKQTTGQLNWVDEVGNQALHSL